MASVSQGARGKQSSRRFDPRPGRVRYSPRWLGAAAGGVALSVAAVAAGGPLAAAAIGAAGLAGAAYTTLVEPRQPRLERITLRFPELPPDLDGVRIGQLSDLHLGQPYSAANSRWAAATMAAERPDLLALTGDFVSYKHAIAELSDVLAPLAVARPPLGAFAVPGNHDYWEGVPAIRAALAPLGVQFLINTHTVLRRGASRLVVAGLDDHWEGTPDLEGAFQGAPDGFRLLLAHCPDVADDAARLGVELQLSGHTHGGHMRLPWLGSFCLPRYGWAYAVGQLRVGPMQLYVSRGVGGLPVRLNCAPEATVMTLRRG